MADDEGEQYMHDRTWMYQRMVGGYINMDFVAGVDRFLKHCATHEAVDRDGDKFRCPCKRCKNRRYLTRDDVYDHLITKGFVDLYTEWVCHGEEHYSRESRWDNAPMVPPDGNYAQLVLDAAGPEFASRMSEMPEDVDESPNAMDKRFFELLKHADRELWGGCEKATQLSAVARLLNIKADYNLSEKCYDAICQLLKDCMPGDNCMVPNFYETKKMIEGLGLPVERIDSCPKGCMLYRGVDATRSKCKMCKEPRYRTTKKGNKVPLNTMFYFPLKPRLKRLYASMRTAALMRWHEDHHHDNTDEMCHPCDSSEWKRFDANHPSFAQESRNVRLGLCTDGFQPFGQSGKQYSCWPVFITPYNLPPHMCMKEEYTFLSLIVPGGGNPKGKIDVYLQPLIDELKELWETGVETYDVSTKRNFVMKAALMWTIGDFPAYGMMSGWGTSGKKACPVCMDETEAIRLVNGRKQSWFDAHRRFLPNDHPFRRNRNKFTKNKVETRGTPERKTGEDILTQFRDYGLLKVTEPDAKEANKQAQNWCGWRKKSIFWDLPYWATHRIRHVLDVMHIEKNFFENIFNTILDIVGKTKDNPSARSDMAMICNRKDLEWDPRTNTFPRAAYALRRKERDAFLNWVGSLRLPDGYASNLGRCVDMKKHRMFGMKSHDCHVFMQCLLPIGMRELLPKNVWEALTELSYFFRRLTTKLYPLLKWKL